MLAIGIDTGGTCTDAVVYDLESRRILSSAKAPTTHEQLENGIREALRRLPEDLVRKSAFLSLSTTLATNACVENKGGRVLLIFIGADRTVLEKTYRSYGFSSMEDMIFLPILRPAAAAIPKSSPAPAAPSANAESRNPASSGISPEALEDLEQKLPSLAAAYDGFAISQMDAGKMNGALEKELAARISQYTDKPVICAFDLFHDLNVFQRGAGAYLNARLIPVIRRFLEAVQHVLSEEGLSIPFVIMRSDGSLVSVPYALLHPVEALLCGPAASVKGSEELFSEPQAVVIDMGGTTTDIALIKNGTPVIGKDGVSVGAWKTFVRGVDIDTFALGGDTRVVYRNSTVTLSERRVLPVSALAAWTLVSSS